MNQSKNPIKVIGVGGGGSNAVNTMYERGIEGVEFIVCNTDAQALDASPVETKIQLGRTLTEGQGAGSMPEVGKNAAIESLDEISELLNQGTRMVFVTAGMGGGTGTGAAPVIAKAARDLGILTVGIVTIPFKFEGRRRADQANLGLQAMRQAVDTLLIIRNDKLRELYSGLTIRKAFMNADEVLCTAAKGIAEVITLTGEINVDMNDVNTVMRDSGRAIMGSGRASGEGRAAKAVREALESPLLNDHDITGAHFVLLNITFSKDEILMDEIMEITDFIQDAAGQSAEVIWGYGIDSKLEDDLSVTVIATGFQALDEESTPSHQTANTMWLGGGLLPKSEEKTPQPAPESVDTPYIKSTTENKSGAWNASLPQSNMSIPQPPISAPTTGLTGWHKPEEPQPTEEEGPTLFNDPTAPAEPTIRFTLPEDEPEMAPEPQNQRQEPEEPSVVNTPSGFTIHTLPNERPEPIQPLDQVDLQERQNARHKNLREFTHKLKTPAGLADLENEPAYKRRKVILDDVIPSKESTVSKYTLNTEIDEDGTVHTNITQNGFLTDQVD